MKVTLRKANALQNSIQDHLKTIDTKVSISINEFQDPTGEVSVARGELVSADLRRGSLTKALYRIRAQVGRANTESGIGDLLADAAYLDKRVGHLKALAESEPTDAEIVLTGKLDKIRNDKTERRIYGYNDTISTGVLNAQQIAGFKADIRELKKHKQAINDKMLELNVRTEIELDADTVAVLTKEQLV
jgi:hypothetical protein